jgi:hypothetical protein
MKRACLVIVAGRQHDHPLAKLKLKLGTGGTNFAALG